MPARRDGGWAYEDLLRELLEAEITNRHQSTARRLLREARFPDIKTFDQLDWTALKGVSRPKLMELASCSSICWLSVMNGARPSSPPIWRSPNGSRCSATKSSRRRCSIASVITPTYSQLAVIPFAASEESKSPPLVAQSKEVQC